MSDHSFDQIERRIAATVRPGAPDELRSVVLADVRRELRAGRWDRRLGRAAALLLAVGVGSNFVIALGAARGAKAPLAGGPSQAALVQTAVAVAEATDAEAGRRVARQMAMLGGWSLTSEQMAALDAAVAKEVRNGKDG
jgi:hypothetical protein